jgi:hypothetical protein
VRGAGAPFAKLPNGASQFRIVVEPNIRVSRDGEYAHNEPDIAANPRNPRNLVGSSIAFTNSGIGAGYETPAYASLDGGWTWQRATLPGQTLGAWDTQVEFGPTGTAFVLTERHTGGGRRNALALYRSEDGGISWQGPIDTHQDLDRNVLVVDHSRSRFRGRVYIASNARGMVLYHSSDDGKTFKGPKDWGCQRMIQMLVLSDGTLWLPCDIVKDDVRKKIGAKQAFSTSNDGGETFTPHVPLETCMRGCVMPRDYKRGEITGYPYNGVVFAVDTTARFRDRIYAVWAERLDKAQDVVLRYSNDKGKTWSAARRVAAPSAEGARQFLPAPAINRDGVLGIFWLESLPPTNKVSHAFFTASVDGGEHFLPARRVTSQISEPHNTGNYALSYFGSAGDSANVVAAFSSGLGRFSSGGEYIGLAADADGVFHPFWPDARSGAFQLYTSRVSVTDKPIPSKPKGLGDSARRIDRAVAFAYDPPVIPTGDERVINARVQNVSSDTIWAPLLVVVGWVTRFNNELQFDYLDTTATIFDPSSERRAIKARIDYSSALGDLPYLAPGAMTDAITWRMRATSYFEPTFLLRVYSGPRTAAQKAAEEAIELKEMEAQKAARAKQR